MKLMGRRWAAESPLHYLDEDFSVVLVTALKRGCRFFFASLMSSARDHTGRLIRNRRVEPLAHTRSFLVGE
jgi:hypothetical protein